jgi:hypothetical protein
MGVIMKNVLIKAFFVFSMLLQLGSLVGMGERESVLSRIPRLDPETPGGVQPWFIGTYIVPSFLKELKKAQSLNDQASIHDLFVLKKETIVYGLDRVRLVVGERYNPSDKKYIIIVALKNIAALWPIVRPVGEYNQKFNAFFCELKEIENDAPEAYLGKVVPICGRFKELFNEFLMTGRGVELSEGGGAEISRNLVRPAASKSFQTALDSCVEIPQTRLLVELCGCSSLDELAKKAVLYIGRTAHFKHCSFSDFTSPETFVKSVMTSACTSPEELFYAIVYCHCYIESKGYLKKLNFEKLFLASLLLANKFCNDIPYNEKVFAQAFMPSLPEAAKQLTEMEHDILKILNFDASPLAALNLSRDPDVLVFVKTEQGVMKVQTKKIAELLLQLSLVGDCFTLREKLDEPKLLPVP